MTATETCRKGHPYTEENTRWVEVRGHKSRQCRQCDKDRAQAKRDRLRGDKRKFSRPLAEKCFRGHTLEGDNLYFYETEWGTQRRCRACDVVRREERADRGETVQPKKTHCIHGHALEGNNLSFTPEGYARCLKCALEATLRHKAANYEHVLAGKRKYRRAAKDTAAEAAWALMVSVFAEDLSDEDLISKLQSVLPPAES